MRTSEQVYHQVRWDPRFDPARFVLGVQQRGARPKRVALTAFTPGGEVPWHRVLFVEADGEVVWDRATGLDRVGESAAGRVRAPRRLRAPVFTASTPHAWDPLHGWTPAREAASPEAAPSTSVLTWNVLWDRYDRDRIDTARRRPLLFGELAAADADVIALQEVEPDLLAALIAQPWVRAGYTLDVDPTGPDVDRTGLVVLSRLPVLEAARFPLGAHKAVAAIVVQTAGGPLVVAATHLTSDHTANGPAKRRAQLGRVAEAFAGVEGDVVLVGDFNDGGRRPAAALGMRDAWLEARDDEPPTFDPVVNPLAAVSSLSGRRSRLDRVFVRGGLRCAGAELVGDRPVDGRFASDHYGVLARLAAVVPSAGVLDSPPTPRTAVVWLPGPWEEVERVRREHDHRADRWPPHVTLLFGFVPEADFDRAVPLLAEAVAEVPPFPVLVDGVREFGPGVVWLDPAAAGGTPWTALHDAVRRRFPACRTRDDFTPHLTVGGSRQAAEGVGARSDRVDEVVVLSRRGDGPMLPRAAVALGTGEVRWFEEPATAPGPSLDAVAERVTRVLSAALGGRTFDGAPMPSPAAGARAAEPDADTWSPEPDAVTRPPTPTPDTQPPRPAPDTRSPTPTPGIRSPTPTPGTGSPTPTADTWSAEPAVGTGSATPTADTRSPEPAPDTRPPEPAPDTRSAAPAAGTRSATPATDTRPHTPAAGTRSAAPDDVHVVGSRRMRCGLPDADLDLVVEVADPTTVAERVAAALPGVTVRPVVGARSPGFRLVVDGLGVDLAVASGDGQALSAVGDAEAVRAAVGGRGEDFARLARAVKAWARARGLDSAPFGGVPGLGWSVLAARTVREWDGPDLLVGFFATWAAWDWRDPIGLVTSPERTGAPVTIMTPTAPVRSCTEQVGPGFRDLLTAELYRAWEIVEAGAPGLSAPPDAHRAHAAWALVTVPHELVGPVRGRMRALLTALEVAGTPDAHAWPRPVERGPDAVRYAIGLGRHPVSPAVLADVVASWRSGLRGVDVVRVGNGDVPTLR